MRFTSEIFVLWLLENGKQFQMSDLMFLIGLKEARYTNTFMSKRKDF